jgi:hypothetical protein
VIGKRLQYGATFAYARIGARWYVKVTLADDNGTHNRWSEPLQSRDEAIKLRDQWREGYIAEMRELGFGAVVVDEPVSTDAKARS